MGGRCKPLTKPRTEFDWAVYADATFAGLSLLIPIPLLDLAFESYFRRRMLKTIARRRNCRLPPQVIAEFNRGDRDCLQSCLAWPIILLYQFLKQLSRKILYFLTVKEAIDQLNYYWHRAFLLNHLMLMECLDDADSARTARIALDEVLDHVAASPLRQLAQQVVSAPSRVWRSLRRARRGREDETVAQTRSIMARTWDNFSDYFEVVATQFEQAYREVETGRAAEA